MLRRYKLVKDLVPPTQGVVKIKENLCWKVLRIETNWAGLGVARVGPLCDGWRDFQIDCTQEFGVECRNLLKKYCRVVNMDEVVAAVSSQNIFSHFFVEGTKPAVGTTVTRRRNLISGKRNHSSAEMRRAC
jgi:hypothetical protein